MGNTYTSAQVLMNFVLDDFDKISYQKMSFLHYIS